MSGAGSWSPGQVHRPAGAGQAVFAGSPSPEEPLCIFGDLHGRGDLAAQMVQTWADHMAGVRLVALGDYVDRGDESAVVLRLLREAAVERGAVCLMGNHEAMMLAFLDAPEAAGPRWMSHGGIQTLASFGLRGIAERMTPAMLRDARDALRKAMAETGPPDMEEWLRGLPVWWQSGNLAMVHAGADPALPIPQQPREVMLWGHPAFLRQARQDGVWVAHGHTIVGQAQVTDGRIALDTGAYATGRLSYAMAGPDGMTLHSLQSPQPSKPELR